MSQIKAIIFGNSNSQHNIPTPPITPFSNTTHYTTLQHHHVSITPLYFYALKPSHYFYTTLSPRYARTTPTTLHLNHTTSTPHHLQSHFPTPYYSTLPLLSRHTTATPHHTRLTNHHTHTTLAQLSHHTPPRTHTTFTPLSHHTPHTPHR